MRGSEYITVFSSVFLLGKTNKLFIIISAVLEIKEKVCAMHAYIIYWYLIYWQGINVMTMNL